MSRKVILLAAGVLLADSIVATSVRAQNLVTAVTASIIKDCDAALVKATYNRVDFKYTDWRLAEQIDEGTYNQVKQDVSSEALIYGVWVNNDYNSFKESIKTLKRERKESYTTQTFRNITWTGLDPNGAKAYSDCLKAAAANSRKALVLWPEKATETDITFKLSYRPSGASAPNPLKVKWTSGDGQVSKLPRSIPAGDTTIIVKRPTRDVTLAVNAEAVGDSDSVVLTPLPKPLPPESKYLSSCDVTETPNPLPQLAKGGSASSWICPPMRAGTYAVTVDILPGEKDGKPVRVAYGLELLSKGGSSVVAQGLPATSGSPIDINANAGLSNRFQSIGGLVTIVDGTALFRLTIFGVAHHCCFPGPGADGIVTIPKNVTFGLRRIELAKQ